MQNLPTIKLKLSDTYGPVIGDPRDAQDIDVIVEEIFGELEDLLVHENTFEIENFHIKERFNIHGREYPLGRHIVMLCEDWHDKWGDKVRKAGIFNMIFVNFADRDKKGEIEPFHRIETDSGLIVVTSNLKAVSGIKEHIVRIEEVPNIGSKLFPDQSQFRSRTAHNAVRKNSKYTLKDTERQVPDDPTESAWLFEFSDVFGNLLTGGGKAEETAPRLVKAVESGNREIKIRIGDVTLMGEAALGLEDGNPGALIAYKNGVKIDITRKWDKDETGQFRRENSGFGLFRGPREMKDEVEIFFPEDDGYADIVVDEKQPT